MKDGITLHPEHGLNPSIEVCMKGGEAKYRERYYKRIRIVFLLIYFIHQIKFWVLACRFVRIGMPISAS